MKPINYFFFWIFLIVLTVIITFISAELLCKIAGVGKPNLTLTGPKHLFVPDPDPQIAFRMRPNYRDFVYGSQVSINPKGLRDLDYPYTKPEGIKRILVLGDSVAFGYGVNEEDTFANQWEALWQEQTPNRYQIINSGVPSYTTMQEVRWFEIEGMLYQPDAVVLTYVMNDPEPVHQLDANGGFIPLEIDQFYAETATLFPKTVLPYTQSSHLMNFLNRLMLHTHPNWHEIHQRLTQYFNHDIFLTPHWDECRASVKRLKDICDENGIYLLAVIYPLMYRLHAVEDHDFAAHYQTALKMMTDENVPCIVPLDDYIGQNVDAMRSYVDDPHPSRASHAILAKRLHQCFAGQTNGITKWDDYE